MPNARSRAASTQSGSPVSSMSLSNPSQPVAAPAPTPRRSQSQRTKPQDDPQALAGVIQTGVVIADRPTSSGRGRVAKEVDPKFAENLSATLAGGSVLFVGDANGANRLVKGFANKWITANGGKEKVTVKYVTDKKRTAQLTKADIELAVKEKRADADSDVFVMAYYAVPVEATAAA